MLCVHCLFKYLFVGGVCARCSPFEQQRIRINNNKIDSLFLNPTFILIFGWWLFGRYWYWVLAGGYLSACVYRKWWLWKQRQGVGDANPTLDPVKLDFYQHSNKFKRCGKKYNIYRHQLRLRFFVTRHLGRRWMQFFLFIFHFAVTLSPTIAAKQ